MAEQTSTPLERRMVAGRPSFGALDGLRARVLGGLVAQAPRTIGRYQLGKVIGSGSFGTVYEARDTRLARRVAIKLISCARTTGETARVLREARMLATLSHPNIVHVFEVGQTDDERRSPYVVMELVQGQTLRRWLADAPRSWREVVAIVVQAARGLHAAHVAGVLHRDVKPDNVLLGDDGRARVIDFGLARSQDDHGEHSAAQTFGGEPSSELTPTGQVMGTPAYMAPEVFASRCTPASDQYSLCVTLYEGLFGARPFHANTTEELHAQISTREPTLPRERRGVPAKLQRIVMRGLRRDEHRRHPDVAALVDALDGVLRPQRVLPAIVLGAGALSAVVAWAAGGEQPCMRGEQAWEQADALPRLSDRIEHGRATYQRSWRTTEQQLCAAADGAPLDAERRHCLDRAARDATALLVVLTALAPEERSNQDDPIAALRSPTECDQGGTVVAPAEDIAAQVRRLEPSLSRLWALATTWQVADGLELSSTLAAQLRSIDYPPMLAEVGYLRGRLLFQASDYEAAASAYEEAFLVAQRSGLDGLAARSATELLRVHGFYRGDIATAQRWASQAESGFVRAGIDPNTQPVYLSGLAGLAGLEGEHERGIELLRQALDVLEPGASFRTTVLQHLGIEYYRVGQYDACASTMTEAAAGFEEQDGSMSPSRSAALDVLGVCQLEQQRYEQALANHREALVIREATLDADHTDLGASYGNLAVVLGRLGQHEEAMAYIARAYALFVRRFGDAHTTVGQSLEIRGELEADVGDVAHARADYERAREIFTAAGRSHRVDLERVEQRLGALSVPREEAP